MSTDQIVDPNNEHNIEEYVSIDFCIQVNSIYLHLCSHIYMEYNDEFCWNHGTVNYTNWLITMRYDFHLLILLQPSLFDFVNAN